MILVIDNYDSFTYNLVQLLGTMTPDLLVRRNDAIALDEIASMQPAGIVISPGPGRPENAGLSVAIIERFGPTIPILGVCLGHQAIGHAFGGRVVHAPTLMHGKISKITHRDTPLYEGIENPFDATRYHSLAIAPDSVPSDLEVTAEDEHGVIMGIRHRRHAIEGVQFHPESIRTPAGGRMLRNWMSTWKG